MPEMRKVLSYMSDAEMETIPLEKMKEEISSKNYVIIGGHVNWVKRKRYEIA